MALSVQRPAKRVRINGKTNVQTPVPGLALDVEEATAVREAYLVTLPHPLDTGDANTRGLVDPGSYSRAQVRDAVLAACEAPAHDAAWLRRHPGFIPQPVAVRKMAIFREYHAADALGRCHIHYHVALLLARPARFTPLKRALLMAARLASNWSCCHTG